MKPYTKNVNTNVLSQALFKIAKTYHLAQMCEGVQVDEHTGVHPPVKYHSAMKRTVCGGLNEKCPFGP